MQTNIFPVRPKPLPGESLWSFVLRLTRINGVPMTGVMNASRVTSGHYIQRADLTLLDSVPSSLIDIDKISDMTGVCADELLRTTFHYVLRSFSVDQELAHARFMATIIRTHYFYCPKCLKEKAYHRLIWKISHIKVCLSHSSCLFDRCYMCNESIKLKDVTDLDACPYCGHRLSHSPSHPICVEKSEAIWFEQAWEALLQGSEAHISPSEVAIRLLYLVSGCSPLFDRSVIESTLCRKAMLPTLLQHARDSLSQKRTLHLSTILSILYEQGFSAREFFQVRVPQTFYETIEFTVTKQVNQLACQAPWCPGYQLPGTLVKTGTTLKRRNNGETLVYYMACMECGCEYAVRHEALCVEATLRWLAGTSSRQG